MELRPYQEEAVSRALAVMRNGGGFGLWLEQRLGKTRTALEIVAKCKPKHLWVICPKAGGAAPEVWWREIKQCLKHLPELDGLPTVVKNYEWWVKHRKERYADAKSHSRLFIICDESHYIKKRGTRRSGVVRRLGKYARWRLALTGTPIAQGIQDAWAQFDFIDPAIFGRFDNVVDRGTSKILELGFDGRYLVWGGYKKHDVIGTQNKEDFYRKFHENSYRRTLREVRDTPLMIKRSVVPVRLDSSTQRIYQELEKDLVTVVNQRKVQVKNVLAALIKLQQVTGGSLLVPQEEDTPELSFKALEDISSEKLDMLCAKIPAGKFIVVARFIHEIERIAARLQQHGLKVQQVRSGYPYNGKFNCDCIVMQEQAGIAVDMSQADTVIYYSMDYSMINFEQSRFRVITYHKLFVQYYFLLAMGTVDEVIYNAVTHKKNVATAVCDTYRTKTR